MGPAKIACPKCGTGSVFGSKYCSQCATPLALDLGATQLLDSGVEQATVAFESTWVDTSQAASSAFKAIGPGSVIGGRYEILRVLGEGGMGAVYEARDREVDRIVAFKVIRPDLAGNKDILRMFKQELVLARQVTHRNVVRIFDIGTADGMRFITMQFVDGRDLKAIIREKGKLSAEETAALMVQVCEGLDAAHKENVVHRDLKPQNIMVDADGRAYVMDFGLAHSTDSGGTQGVLLGTPDYMSPEQAKREDVDARSDIFTVGVILYEMLTGEVPLAGNTLNETLQSRITGRAAPPIEKDPSIPKAISDITYRCMAPALEERYQNIADIVYELQVFRGVIVPANTRLWKRLSLAFAVLVLGLIGFSVTMLMRRPPVAMKPLTTLIADFTNQTGEPVLNGTLEPLFGVAMEGSSFINAYNRVQARQIAGQIQQGAKTLDENMARLVAVREGLNVVISGAIVKSGNQYVVSARALDAVTGKETARSEIKAPNKEKLLASMGVLAQPIRKGLGDRKTVADKFEAGETFTAASLEAAHNYSLGQEAQLSARYDEALDYYKKAVALDPTIGRAYSGMGVIYRNLGERADAEKNLKIALSHIAQMGERERFRTRGAYYVTIGSYEKAADEYNTLVKQFPADNAGHANLAICYLYLRNLPRAIEEGRKAIEIYPKNVAQKNNVASYLLYAGKFDEAAAEADGVLKLNPSFERAYVVKALAALAVGHADQASAFYEQAGKAGARGASYRSLGLADIALYEGRAADAVTLLEEGIKADTASGKTEWAAQKHARLAEALVLIGNKAAALKAAGEAVGETKEEGIHFLAARVYVDLGQDAKAQAIAQDLSKSLENEPQAYARLIAAELALARGDAREAIKATQDARKLIDTWIGRYDSGRAYLAGGATTEADSEFDACIRRSGEATALFVDLLPTFSFFPPCRYYMGRAQEGLGSPAATQSFQLFVQMRGKATRDPLVIDAKKRMAK